MQAWAKDQRVEGSIITFMSDTQGSLTKELGVLMEHPGPTSVLGTPRCKRHALYVEDGVIKAFEVAEGPDDPAGDDHPDVTLVENMLSKVPDLDEPLSSVEEEKKQDKEAADAEIKKSDLALFVKPGCPFCKDALETLQSSGFDPLIIDTTRPVKRGLEQITGVTSVPYCFAKGKYIGGCNDGPEEWMGVKPCVASGSLKDMLK